MLYFSNSIKAWGTSAFKPVLKIEIEQLKAGSLPLQAGLRTGNYALDTNLQAMILDVVETSDSLQVKVGIFYTSIIGGCSCADDPSPVDENNEYCDVLCTINKVTGAACIQLIDA